MNGEPFTTDVVGCARCDGDGHPDLLFRPFTRPVDRCDGETPFTYWSMCPTVNEPILMLIEEET